MRKFYNYFEYAAWRDGGDNCDTPVKLIGADAAVWCERYETKKDLTELRDELQAEREHADRLYSMLHMECNELPFYDHNETKMAMAAHINRRRTQ